MYKTSQSISESELSSSETKHLFIANTPQHDPIFKPDYYHQLTTLPSLFKPKNKQLKNCKHSSLQNVGLNGSEIMSDNEVV